jgi:hypothetical protein
MDSSTWATTLGFVVASVGSALCIVQAACTSRGDLSSIDANETSSSPVEGDMNSAPPPPVGAGQVELGREREGRRTLPESQEPVASESKPATPAGGSDEESVTTATAKDALPGAAEYCRHAISLEGLEAFAAQHSADITAETTTSDVCHTLVKPATVPGGWVDEVALTNSEKRWFAHSYREEATGRTQSVPPSGTRSYCELLLADPATSRFVGRPTVFFSHAWLYSFLNVLAALRAFVAAQPEGEPGLFFWFDCFSIDEHATQALPQEWWGTTFKEAIALMGHTVMMLSPWDSPQPLTRAWCLWELFCTVSVGARFSVCLGPHERAALAVGVKVILIPPCCAFH